MLSISFTCLKSRQNKAGQSPIQLWVNVDGKRATTILNLRATPSEFKKAMKSKQNTPVLQYCNNVREKITTYYTNAVQGSGKIKNASDNQSPHYTTKWSDIPKVSVK